MRRIVLYDGDCGLCQKSVQWLLDHDRHQKLLYSPLQGETASVLLQRVSLPEGLDSIVLVEEENDSIDAYWYSSAFLRLLPVLPFPWSMGVLGWIVPQFLRDIIYRWIAKNRIRWFGHADQCRLPTAEEQTRFLP